MIHSLVGVRVGNTRPSYGNEAKHITRMARAAMPPTRVRVYRIPKKAFGILRARASATAGINYANRWFIDPLAVLLPKYQMARVFLKENAAAGRANS